MIAEERVAAAVDFPDGAQRFSWCSCRTPAQKSGGLRGVFDFGFWDRQLGGDGVRVELVPVAAPSPFAGGPNWIMLGAAIAVLFLVLGVLRRGGGRRRR